jgi:hypothetical protein
VDASPPAPAPRNEASLMAELRELGATDPERSLKLARDGRAQFKESADAPERSWFVVKSLMNLGRIDEARAEARTMLEKYRNTSWADDVHRHLFVNPPTHPLERGYGKKNELD